MSLCFPTVAPPNQHRGVVPSIASTIIYNLPYGGPVSMVWGWAVSSILIMFIGLAMVSQYLTIPS